MWRLLAGPEGPFALDSSRPFTLGPASLSSPGELMPFVKLALWMVAITLALEFLKAHFGNPTERRLAGHCKAYADFCACESDACLWVCIVGQLSGQRLRFRLSGSPEDVPGVGFVCLGPVKAVRDATIREVVERYRKALRESGW